MPSKSKAITEAPPLPITIRSFLKREPNINDDVQGVFLSLAEDPETSDKFRSLLAAIYNSQAKEGSMIADDFEAARMIRENAERLNYSGLANENLTTIKLALGVVTRRCHVSRAERREEERRNGDSPAAAQNVDGQE